MPDAQPETRELIPQGEVLKRLPDLSQNMLVHWRRSRKIRTEPVGPSGRFHLYDYGDVLRERGSRIPGHPQDEIDFEGERWIWVETLPEKHKMGRMSPYRWRKKSPVPGLAVIIRTFLFTEGG